MSVPADIRPIPGVDWTISTPSASDIGAAAGNLLGNTPLGSAVNGFSEFSTGLRNTIFYKGFWIRAAAVVGGTLLIWWGILILIASNDKVQNLAGKAVAATTPVGAAAEAITEGAGALA